MDGRGSIKELFPTGKQLEPLVAPLADGKVAVGQDDLTVVLNEEGVCTQKCALNWTDIPIAMGKEDNKLHSQLFSFRSRLLCLISMGTDSEVTRSHAAWSKKDKKQKNMYVTRFYLTSLGFHITLSTIL